MAADPIKTVELDYPMSQFLLITDSQLWVDYDYKWTIVSEQMDSPLGFWFFSEFL